MLAHQPEFRAGIDITAEMAHPPYSFDLLTEEGRAFILEAAHKQRPLWEEEAKEIYIMQAESQLVGFQFILELSSKRTRALCPVVRYKTVQSEPKDLFVYEGFDRQHDRVNSWRLAPGEFEWFEDISPTDFR